MRRFLKKNKKKIQLCNINQERIVNFYCENNTLNFTASAYQSNFKNQ